MRMGPRHSYVCLISPPPVDNTSVQTDDAPADVTPVHTWSLLQPLSGTCLFVRNDSVSLPLIVWLTRFMI